MYTCERLKLPSDCSVCFVYWTVTEVNQNKIIPYQPHPAMDQSLGQSISYPQAQFEITSNPCQRRAP